MKLLDTKCPHCGANLIVDLDHNTCTCGHCGATLLIDDERQSVRYDDAEEAGYRFERGRQRAAEEYYRHAHRRHAPDRDAGQRYTHDNYAYSRDPGDRDAGDGRGDSRYAYDRYARGYQGHTTGVRRPQGMRRDRRAPTWLWVLGWLVFFPIPLTVLIARSHRISSRQKQILIAVLWAIILLTSVLHS